MRPFSDNSPFNTPAGTILDPSSATIAAAIGAEAAKATVNTTSWSVPVYRVAASQPTVKVTVTRANQAALQNAWNAVPLPANAKPAGGTDRHLVVWQPSTDRLWEFYGLENIGGSWSAAWGGAIQGVSMSPGAYDPTAWAGATNSWGASACSISIVAGLITLDDLAAGCIDHALAMAAPITRAGVWAAPAKRTDGWSSSPSSIPEGARMRLDPSLDLESLELPAFTRLLARAAQTYGIFVRDSSSAMPFYAEDPSRLIAEGHANPYTGATGYFGGSAPSQLLTAFPWSHLQLLQMQLS